MANLLAPSVQESPVMIVSSLLLPLILLACPQEVSTDERVAWLAEHAKPLTSLDLRAEDDSDLKPLKRAVAGRRIVLLGEQSHGDGETFRAKARLAGMDMMPTGALWHATVQQLAFIYIQTMTPSTP